LSRLGEPHSLERDPIRSTTQNFSPEREVNINSTNASSRPCLGESFSPKREYQSLNISKTPRLDEKSHSTHASFIATSLRRASFA